VTATLFDRKKLCDCNIIW